MQLINNVVVIFLVLVVGFNNAKSQQISYANSTELIDSLLIGYDKRLRPNYGGDPVNVEVSIYVLSFDSFSDCNMDYTMNIYFRQYWNDPRLAFQRAGTDVLSFGHEFSKLIWLPDTFFVNEKHGFAHSVTAKNEFIKVHSSGDVARSLRLSVTASCPMNFRSFPMDTQVCPLSIESYGYTARDIKYTWKNQNAVGTENTLSVFELKGHIQKSQVITVTSGNYSRLNVEFELKRMTGHYLTQIYIPCTMLVILSWISFWLNRRAANVRLVLCTLSLVLMAVGLTIVSYNMPKTSYTKAIDVYMGACMTFVFAALIEFAFVSNTSSDKDDISAKIDKIFRYGYAALFVTFNVIYWLVY
ncbi:Gamma-aminobutyric acid receptor subunit beta [Pseudolycoriella hygida]|uniref:Gamma-aminobutyric acid receptor subunit beta n=1 Tax=Pseudolycoriella hygida TaxID=35572 RepID=A0A9Q0MT56_9DIPT|nr:Gamma-aminobutyric acid receptor subunit beta [Pseudolycoriella hygida]